MNYSRRNKVFELFFVIANLRENRNKYESFEFFIPSHAEFLLLKRDAHMRMKIKENKRRNLEIVKTMFLLLNASAKILNCNY